ncbi:MAG: RDD family protein [Rhodanobacter sp.]|nr:MAG: RDD family protein [Rhodanobacter sp.]TAM05059.1 MAG: RDD family protein [Rhodanobacter sp.]TAM38914.1 MAG: RDD family protein [Rhodanobacter sp.]TAN28580.1 MAG: RDD family protein [Rhodanobacter sp.]
MEIWIGRDGERHGPYKEEDVREWLRSGKVSPADLAWYEGLADWQPLSVLLRDEVPNTSAASDNPYVAPTAPLQALPQTTAAALEDYAGFWKRVAAYILDAIVLYIPNMLIMKALGGDAAQETMKQAVMAAPGDMQVMVSAYEQFYSTMGTAMIITTVLAWLYFAVLEGSPWQATLGKLALGIRVTDLHGQRISFPRALGRYPAKFLSVLIVGIGFLMVAWTRRKQGLHDMIAGTLVLNGRASEFKPNQASPDNNHSFSA